MDEKIGVVGLGYIGLPLLAAFANVGHKVIGMDINSERISMLQRTFEADIYEPGLNETLKRCKDKIEFTPSYEHLMQQCSTVLITVNTPVAPSAATPKMENIDNLTSSLGKHLRKGQTIILKSTVYPGTTRQLARNLGALSDYKVGTDFFVAFSPERTLEGLALYELNFLPKIVGGVTPNCTEKATAVIKTLGGKITKVSSPEVAEMCKLVDNVYRATSIAFANEIGYICEQIGISAYEVNFAASSGYDRTPSHIPGLGVGGPCLSKDCQILKNYTSSMNIEAALLDATIARNKKSTSRVAEVAVQFIQDNKIEKPTLALCGLAFKGFPYTDDTRGSPAIDIQDNIKSNLKNVKFKYYDPIVKIFLENPVSHNLKDTIMGSNVITLLTNHPALMNLDAEFIVSISAKPLLIVDCWHSVLNIEKAKGQGVTVFLIGEGGV